MEKHGLSLKDVLTRREKVLDDIVKREIPPALFEKLADRRSQAVEIWKDLIEQIEGLDPTLRRTAELAAAASRKQFDFIEKKITQAARRKDEVLRGQVERMASALAPRGGLQERTLTALPFLARYGGRVLDQALAAIEPFAPEHRGVVIDA